MQKWVGCLAIILLIVNVEAEICNNGCGNSTESFCEKRKWKADGIVEQCVDKTTYGLDCASSCKKGDESYFWCYTSWHTNANNWDGTSTGAWEYCAPLGHTRYDVPCVSECAREGKEYWWCYTAHDSSKWEYCSPPSQVKAKKVTYTIYGQECTGECGTHGKKYWWCEKTPRWPGKSGRGGKNPDASWDYCSPAPQVVQNSGSQNSSEVKAQFFTRYNEPCKDACESRDKDYFWCNTIDSWDYCSPKVLATEPVIAKGGRPCVGICDTMGKSYKWCAVFNAGHSNNWWDYCGEKTDEASWVSWVPALVSISIVILIGVLICIRKSNF